MFEDTQRVAFRAACEKAGIIDRGYLKLLMYGELKRRIRRASGLTDQENPTLEQVKDWLRAHGTK